MPSYLALFLVLPCVTAVERVYHIGIVEEIWNYAPSGLNLITGVPLENDTDASVFYQNATNRIGSSYKKALYYEYTDDTFTIRLPKDPKLGFLAPTIIGEIDDVITIHAKNFASRAYSLHPHGVQYLKKSEGALYVDGTPDAEKSIAPTMTKTYTWNMHAEYGPTDYDPDCSTYMYHSHVDTMRDTYSGLLGAMLVCRKGSLQDNGMRRDVDRNFVLNFYVVDENLSWYIDDNIATFVTDNVDPEDADFQESNMMHSVNGLGYGNLQGLTACEGEKIGWNVFGFGNEVDIHSVQFEKQTINVSNHRQDMINVFAAAFKSVTMVAANPGESMISCRVNDHYTAGMYTSLSVSSTCGSSVAPGVKNSAKNIYIAIEETVWNYGPSGMNLMTGENLTASGTDSSTFFLQEETRIGGNYKKALFVGYDDSTYTTLSATKNEMGLLGPLIAVEIGDTILVTLKNNASLPFNIEPHGLQFSNKTAVQPGETYTFTWTAPDYVSPTSKDPDCIAYLYTSTVHPVKDTNSGLVGPLLLCKRGKLAAALSRDAYYLLFSVLDENQSHYLEENILTYATASNTVDAEDEDFQESNLMHSINGLMYGNLQDISLCVGRETDFHVIGLGTEVDMHSMFASGVNIRVRNENTQVISVFPHTTATTTVVPTSTGNGEIKCVVVDHLSGGMLTSYSVSQSCSDTQEVSSRVTRHYFIGVVEEDWDYVHGSEFDTFGKSFNDPDTPGYTFVHQQDGSFIGSVYKKAMYYEYSDSDFNTNLNKAENMGVLGPVIGGEAGDTIKITFRNMAANRNYSITPWGAKDKNDPFNSDTSGVLPGEEKIYEWIVPDNAVPPEGQPGCNAWIYRSNVDEIKDAYSGLLGPLLLCRTGSFNGVAGTSSYQEDFYLLFFVFDENQSHYLDDNIEKYAKAKPSTFNKDDADFQESNLMHGINGIIYGLGGLNTTRNDEVLWHLMGYGNEVDIHTVHFHAHAFTYISDVTTFDDVFNLYPGKIGTVQMRTTEPGTWLMHCHVDDHIHAGMVTTFTVSDSAQRVGRGAWQIALLVIICKSLISE